MMSQKNGSRKKLEIIIIFPTSVNVTEKVDNPVEKVTINPKLLWNTQQT